MARKRFPAARLERRVGACTRQALHLDDPGKRAGAITQTQDGFMLAPGPDESPKLNGRPIPTEGTKLKNGDVIEVAGTRLQFYLK